MRLIPISLQKRTLRDVIAEYDQKLAAIPQAIKDFAHAGDQLKASITVAGVWGDVRIERLVPFMTDRRKKACSSRPGNTSMTAST
jgi:hypothetical protein